MRKTYIGCALIGLFVLLGACRDRQPVAPTLLQPQADSVRLCGTESDTGCVLEPVSGTVDPKKPTDDEGGEEDESIGGSGGGDAGGGGSAGGGGGTPSDDPPPGDTIPSDTACRATGDTLVDKTQVQDAFDTVWAGSNADASDSWHRRERGGWILKTATGYVFQEFTDWRSEPCAMVPLSDGALTSPNNAIAWIHSHPFKVGEIPNSCKRLDRRTGLIVVSTYLGVPSPDDIVTGEEINNRRNARGLPSIDGFILDKDGIRRFKPFGTGAAYAPYPSINRCAY